MCGSVCEVGKNIVFTYVKLHIFHSSSLYGNDEKSPLKFVARDVENSQFDLSIVID